MKYLKLFVLALFAAVGFTACMPDSPEMEAADISAEELVMGEAYSITQDSEDPNTIYLKSLLPASYTPLWEHPQGRSQQSEVTLHIAFKGDYVFTFGVMTRGGVVYGEPYTLTLTTDNLAYVDDPMWNLLTGGPGQSKSWKLDLDADGNCKYFVGPLYFYGTDDWYGNVNGGQEATDYNGDGAIDSWNWQADWAGNGSWLFGGTGAMDYGTMTFDLIDGAHLTVEDLAAGTTTTGTFLLDTENYMLTTSDAFMLHDPGRDAIVTKWGEARVILLTEDLLQLGVIRDNDPSEGPCLLVYNYVRDGYVPPAVEEPEGPTEPVLPEGWMDTVGEITQTSIKWTLSTETPMNWHSVAGVPLNTFNSAADYPDWLGTPDPAVYEGFSLTMDSADNSYTAVAPDGTEVAGTYTLDEKGIYTFDQPLPSFSVISWASFATDADNQLRILEIGTKNGIINDMWVGAKSLNEDGSLKEYMSYHLVANVGAAGGATPEAPKGTELAVDNTKLVWGDLENNGNLRIELYNEYGSTAGENSPIDLTQLVVNEKISIAFTVSGVEFVEGAAGSYDGVLSYADADWTPQYWGENGPEFTFTGNGSYVVNHNPASAAEGAMVFVIDIKSVSADIVNLDAVKVTIDQIIIDGGDAQSGGAEEGPVGTELAVDNAKIAWGDIENNGNFRIELYNEWGSTSGDNSSFDRTAIAGINAMEITFSIAGVTLNEGAAGSYPAGGYFADEDWSSQFDNKELITVTGDGTYTVRFDLASSADGVMVFVIDVVGMGTDIADMSAVTATIDKVLLF